MALLSAPAFETGCRVEIEQSAEHFHAHVELDGTIPIFPGDRVRVHGDPIHVAFGEKTSVARTATVQRAGTLRRAWTRVDRAGSSTSSSVRTTPRAASST